MMANLHTTAVKPYHHHNKLNRHHGCLSTISSSLTSKERRRKKGEVKHLHLHLHLHLHQQTSILNLSQFMLFPISLSRPFARSYRSEWMTTSISQIHLANRILQSPQDIRGHMSNSLSSIGRCSGKRTSCYTAAD